MSGRLKGLTAVVLGASSPQGIGAATARMLAAEGATVLVAARRDAPLAALASEIGGSALACDITDEESLHRLADTAVTRHGSLDIAVNCAGINYMAPIGELSAAAMAPVVAVQLTGPLLFFKAMAARMTKGGAIVTTSSLTAKLPGPGLAAYAATKAGIDQAVRVAAVELGPQGIRVNAVAPGLVRTEMTEAFFAMPGMEPAFARETPLGRIARPEDIARAVLALADPESFITGEVVQVNGGAALTRLPTMDEMAG